MLLNTEYAVSVGRMRVQLVGGLVGGTGAPSRGTEHTLQRKKHITGSNKSRCSGVNHGSHERYLQSSMLWQTAQSVCLDFQDPHEVDDRTARKPWLLRRSEWSMHMEEQAS